MKQKVYLAGGFVGGWQDEVIKSCKRIKFFYPKAKEDSGRIPLSINGYSTWDLHYINKSDIVFVYCQKHNPSCIGLSVEAGYAKGLGKTVILVLEPENTTIKDRYLQFISKVADITFETLEDGIEYLKNFE